MVCFQNHVLAAEQRQKVAHGASRGFGTENPKPRRGDRLNVSNGFSFAPLGLAPFYICPTAHAVGYLLAHLRC